MLEEIADDDAVLRGYHALLQPAGHLIALVPAHAWLFGPADQTLGHLRRYAQPELHTKLQNAGFDVVHLEEFNRLGAWGWWLNKQLGQRKISSRQLRAFGWLLPIAKAVEAMKVGRGMGLIAVGRKR